MKHTHSVQVNSFLQYVVVLILFLQAALVSAQTSKYISPTSASKTEPDILIAALVKHFAKVLAFRFGAPADALGKPRLPAVLLVDQAADLLGKQTQFEEFVVLSEAELVAKQIGSFILIKQIGASGDDVIVEFDTPSNATFGTMRISAGPSALRVERHDTYRSGSGSRATYGRLYQKAICRNGTEMAYRWNYYADRKGSGVCPSDVFPEAENYAKNLKP